MNSIADRSVIVQTSSHSVPSTPPWFGEVALIVQHLHQQGILSAISELQTSPGECPAPPPRHWRFSPPLA
jgi:hypothetical protein